MTLAGVCFMFVINIVNWVIDFVYLNVVARLTLIDNANLDIDLATKYSDALQVASHWTLVQTTLASYLVSQSNNTVLLARRAVSAEAIIAHMYVLHILNLCSLL